MEIDELTKKKHNDIINMAEAMDKTMRDIAMNKNLLPVDAITAYMLAHAALWINISPRKDLEDARRNLERHKSGVLNVLADNGWK